MELKEFLDDRAKKCRASLDEIDEKIVELEKANETSQDEAELKDIGDTMAELQAEKAELEAELKEIEAQIAALEKEKEVPEVKPEDNQERKQFLNFEVRGEKKMANDIEERKAAAEEFKRSGRKTIKNAEMRATLVSSGTIATPTEVSGITPTFNQVFLYRLDLPDDLLQSLVFVHNKVNAEQEQFADDIRNG